MDISEKLYQTLPTSLPSVCDASPTVDSADRLNDSNGPESPRVRERSFDRSQSNPEKLVGDTFFFRRNLIANSAYLILLSTISR